MVDHPLLRALDLIPGTKHPWAEKPFTVEVGKDIWSVATDGCMLLGLKTPSNFELVDRPHREPIAKLLRTNPVQPSRRVEVKALRLWAGQVPEDRTFDRDSRPEGVLFGIVIDKRRLACLLEHVIEEQLDTWESTTVFEVKSVAFDGPGWRLVLAGIDTEPEDQPRFFAEEKTPFQVAMEIEEDDPLAGFSK